MSERGELRELGAPKEAVDAHYSLGNEFFALWLDESMSYTAAMVDDDDHGPREKPRIQPLGSDLEQAQKRKLSHHARAARIGPGARVLDVGCGWGDAMRHAVDECGAATVVGLTLSRPHAEFIRALGDSRLDVREESWIDHQPDTPYNAIVSLEAMKTFARIELPSEQKVRVYGAFFERAWSWLEPKGRLSLQVITLGSAGVEDLDEFIAREIFTQADLPRLAELSEAWERHFEVVSLANHRLHYAATLSAWRRRLAAHRLDAEALVGVAPVRRFERVLRLSEYMFQVGSCDLLRIALERVEHPRAAIPGRAPSIPRPYGGQTP